MYLLDTNHCSRLIFGEPTVSQKVKKIGETLIATNLIVAGELIFMAHKSEYKEDNLAKVKSFLEDINLYTLNVIQENLILVSTDQDFLKIKQVNNFLLENWLI